MDHVRAATFADLADLAAIYCAGEGAVRAQLGASAVEAVDLAAWFGERMRGETPSTVFIVPGKGFIEVSSAGEVVALYVVPECWGTGVAQALHERALDHLRARSIIRARLIVIARNTRARRFYARRGWELAGHDEPREIGGVEVAFVRYELAL